MKQKSMTAAEFIKLKNLDENYKREQQLRKEREDQIYLEKAKIESQLIEELKTKGIVIQTVDDLINLNETFPNEVLDILFKWLPKLSNRYSSQEFIVRGVTKQELGIRAKMLTNIYDLESSNTSLKWAIANCLANSKVEGIEDWLMEKMKNKNIEIALAASRNLDPAIVLPFLQENFEKLNDLIFQSLGEIGGKLELNFLQNKVSDYKGYVKKQIEKAIKKIINRLD